MTDEPDIGPQTANVDPGGAAPNESFQKAMIVVFGIVIGSVLALILGLSFGWILFVC